MRINLKFIPLLIVSITFIIFISEIVIFTMPALAEYKVEIGLPGMTTKTISDPGQYVKYLFIFGLSLAGFLAVGAIALGGINYMLAGSITSVDKAKGLIIGALSGIALLLCSWLLLTTIDPTLTNLSPQIPPVGNIAAPPPLTGSPQTYLTKQADIDACTAKCAPNPIVFVPENNNCYCQGAPPATEKVKTCWCDKNNCYKTKDACPLFFGVANCIARSVPESTSCQ